MLKYNVHVSSVAQLSILNYMSMTYNKNYKLRDAVEIYMNNIFDAVNRTIEPYKVQVIGDYSRLTFEELPISIPPDKICQTNNAVETINNAAKIALGWPVTPGIGNRIIIYQCVVGPPNQIKKKIEKIGDCGNLAVFHTISPGSIVKDLVDTVQGALTNNSNYRNSPNSQSYIKNLCNYVKTCAVNNSHIGHLMKGLVNLKNNHRARIYEIEGDRK
ncbi:hypothetical protein NGRA_3468 [Nosema granulosis]|uniref:Uncharacterized protein n=1 Tax=Nosema granulosis TaxID=83296 RepID=A0A9P6GUP8_9MICR|nr:hypothetical protein NGRA_3468 [Nosema granulosis]